MRKKNDESTMTTKAVAYHFFLNALSRRIVRIQHALDEASPGSPQMSGLTAQLTETQRLLAALDDIANAVVDA
jgi:hypothetical protein